MLKKLTLCWGLVLCTILSFGQKFPEKSATLLTDYTNTLSADQQHQLEQKLFTHNDTSAIKIAVVIMKSVGEYDIAEYAALLGRNWGIGNKENNTGILVLVAIEDRKMTIQTGYGAEGALPDAITQSIIQNDMKPRFKAGDYYGGLDAAVDDIVKYTKGEYKAEPSKRPKKSRDGSGGGSAAGFIIIIVIVIIISIFKRRGGGGGGGHIIGSRGGASPFWWFLAGSALGNSGRSSGSDWGGFSGGGGGGGGWGGGSGGSFGGGSFGGGGSSGSW